MHAIEVRRRIDSETPTLPQLQPLIGHTVRITVVDEGDALSRAADEFWKPPALDELVRRQDVGVATESSHVGPCTADEFDGFDEFRANAGQPGEGDR